MAVTEQDLEALIDDEEGEEEPQRGGLTDDEIASILKHDIDTAQSYLAQESADDRAEALDYYMQRPRGDELEGRSQVISADVADVIEWVLPEVLKAFNAPESTVQFDPVDDGDEEQANLETEAVHHVFYTKNNGFLTLYTFVKDALLLRNSVVKIYQDESVRVSRETHEGLNDIEFAMLMDPEDGSTVLPVDYETEQVMAPAPPELQMQGVREIPAQLHNVTIKRVSSKGRARTENLAPENFLYDPGHNSLNLDDVRFCAHERTATEAELIAEGWPQKVVKDLPTYVDTDWTGEESARRPSGTDTTDYDLSDLDKANRPIRVFECYKKLDVAGDGFPELYMVHVAGDGSNYKIIDKEPVDEHPFVATTCIIMTHTFEGVSLYDRMKQIQDIKTSLVRNILDNLYFQNNQRHEVVEKMVNLDDMLTNRPGGIVRTKAPGMINPIVVNPTGAQIYQFLEYLDVDRGRKTGISPDDMRQNNRLPSDTAHGIERLMSAKEELVGLIIRVIAETGIAPLMIKIRNLLVRYQDSEMPLKISGKWTTVSPRDWQDSRTTTVTVGLGTGDRARQLQSVREVIAFQAQVAAGGGKGILVTDKNMYRAFCDLVRFSQLGQPEDYWQDPDSEEAQSFVQQQQQLAQGQEAQETQFEQMIVQIQAQLERQEQMLRYNTDMAELAFKYRQLAEDTANKMTELEVESQQDVPESRV